MPDSSQQKEKRRMIIGFTLVFLVFAFPLFHFTIVYVGEFVFGFGDESHPKTEYASTEIHYLKFKIFTYKMHNRVLPTTEQGLSALVQAPEDARSKRKLADAYEIQDPWGHPYRYQRPGLKSGGDYDLWSAGYDGLDGTKDDILGWDEELAPQ